MDEERKYPDPLALSEAAQSVDQENPAVSQDGMGQCTQDRAPEIAPEGVDSVADSALSGEEVEEQEIELRLPLRSGAERRRRLVRTEDQPGVVLTGAQRLLLLYTWRRSQLPAGDFAPLIGVWGWGWGVGGVGVGPAEVILI